MSVEGKKYLENLKDTEIIRLQPEKDDTDTQSTLNLAIAKGSENILILGATGGRIDHLIGNLGLLTLGKLKGVSVAIADAQNYICLVKSGTILSKAGQFGKYVSFFSAGEAVEGLTLKGFKYPLNNFCLTTADSGLTVSNEIRDDTAQITYDRGSLMMVMSRD